MERKRQSGLLAPMRNRRGNRFQLPALHQQPFVFSCAVFTIHDLPYLRIREYGDDALRLAKHSMHLGPPLPNAGEGLGGEHTGGVLAHVLETLPRADLRELI